MAVGIASDYGSACHACRTVIVNWSIATVWRTVYNNVSAFHIYGDSFQAFVGVFDIDGTILHRQGIIRMERIISRIDADGSFFNCDITLRVQCVLYRCDIKGTVLYGKELFRI